MSVFWPAEVDRSAGVMRVAIVEAAYIGPPAGTWHQARRPRFTR
jgi:hypothetical protein